MTTIIHLFYLILLLGISVVGVYICYHILRYSLSKKNALAVVSVFAGVFLFLLLTNAVIFSQVDWNKLFSTTATFPSFPSVSSRY
ncbi:MAG: hypothetical protein WCJ25_02570 [Candidatus Moraniibacteriota bacterium]